MARGRMIANAITSDKRVNDLSSDTSRLAFTWLVTFADCEGRTYGDPAMVRSMLFPRRDDVTTAQVAEYIQEWVRLGLVIWYEAEGDRWIYFPAFAKNQPGLRKDHEQPSTIPAPDGVQDAASTAQLRSDDVATTAQPKLTEVKLNRNEEKGRLTEPNSAAPAALDSVPSQASDSVSIDIPASEPSTDVESPELEDAIRRWSGALRDSGAVESNLTQAFAIWGGYPQIRAPDMVRLVNDTGRMVQGMRNVQKPMAYFFRSIRGHLERKLGPPRDVGEVGRIAEPERVRIPGVRAIAEVVASG